MLYDALPLRDRVKRRIIGISTSHKLADDFHHQIQTLSINRQVEVVGFLDYKIKFLEFPPGSGNGIKVSLEKPSEPPINGIVKVVGKVKVKLDPKGITGTKYLQVQRIEQDYYSAYDSDRCSLTMDEIYKLLDTQINLDPVYLRSLVLSAVSSPRIMNRMGGISSIIDVPKRIGKRQKSGAFEKVEQLSQKIQGLVPSWHRLLGSPGFSLTKVDGMKGLTSLIRNRRSMKPELSLLYPRTALLDPIKDTEASMMENILTLAPSDFEIDNAELEVDLEEVQWAVMFHHTYPRRIGEKELPRDFDKVFDDWIKSWKNRDEFLEGLYRHGGILDRNFMGRRGMVARLAASSARWLGRDSITIKDVKKILKLQDRQLSDLSYLRPSIIKEYEEERGLTPKGKSKRLLDAILDIAASQGVFRFEDILKEAKRCMVSKEKARVILQELVRRGDIYEPRPKLYRAVN